MMGHSGSSFLEKKRRGPYCYHCRALFYRNIGPHGEEEHSFIYVYIHIGGGSLATNFGGAVHS